jgi:protein phosphatase
VRIEIPELAVVVLIGASGSGKSTFARSHFLPSEIVSSDACRAIVDDDEASMSATDDAFDLLHHTMRLRLKRGRLTVVDATNVQPGARKPLLAIAREFHAVPVAIVLKVPPKVCHERNQGRPNRDFGPHVTRNHWQELRHSLPSLRREGFRYVYELDEGEIAEVEVVRTPLWPNKKELTGPFDIVGDVHGCFDELLSLLDLLGYAVETPEDAQGTYQVVPPAGRRLIFVGDLVDRGPRSADCLRPVMDAVAAGAALAVPGNHDDKLLRKLQGRDVKLLHGLEQTWAELEAEGDAFKDRARQFLDGLVSHLVLDGGRLVVAHAGLPESMQGRASGAVRSFSLYGDVTGETDEYGLPVRHNWAAEYRGSARVVYGHTPIECVFAILAMESEPVDPRL